ncbi:Palmitoyltransferase akr1 [Zancudomyces culisetae]|uniref:Palmitoyltransferase akr1 n=1 Tax=Zancudomyces culisetae TaxID=1213189 RepID=A0A1R1PEW1_ZANCU|nr:Palmitoyltransferase akr1 [Zancudomyces culisetae]|eukprot:OMH79504.1 Palmitoyltransferase akr1 [Zancudomyces culisetae]
MQETETYKAIELNEEVELHRNFSESDMEGSDMESEGQDEIQEIINGDLPLQEKKAELNNIFRTAAINGELRKLKGLWEDWGKTEQWIDIDGKDEEGMTGLILASYFGRAEVVRYLLEQGATVDVQDNKGWTALMWAVNKENITELQILLEYGAKPETKTSKGHSVTKVATIKFSGNTGNKKNEAHIIEEGLRMVKEQGKEGVCNDFDNSSDGSNEKKEKEKENDRSGEDKGSKRRNRERSDSNKSLTDKLKGLQEHKNRKKSIELAQRALLERGEGGEADINERDALPSSSGIVSEDQMIIEKFDWKHIQPSQMYVISEQNLGRFIRKVILESEAKRRVREQKGVFVAAALIFLGLRFTVQWGDERFFENMWTESVAAITHVIQKAKSKDRQGDQTQNKSKIVELMYWQVNLQMLKYYLDKDKENIKSEKIIPRVNDCLNETYVAVVEEITKMLAECIDESILDYTDEYFVNDENQSKGQSKHRSQTLQNSKQSVDERQQQSLSSILMQSSRDSWILKDKMGNPLLNRHLGHIFGNAQSGLTDTKIKEIFEPVNELLLLLHVLTTFTSLNSFYEVVDTFKSLNILHLSLILNNYTYDLNEPRICPQIICAIQPCATRIKEHIFHHTSSSLSLSISSSSQPQHRTSIDKSDDVTVSAAADDFKSISDLVSNPICYLQDNSTTVIVKGSNLSELLVYDVTSHAVVLDDTDWLDFWVESFYKSATSPGSTLQRLNCLKDLGFVITNGNDSSDEDTELQSYELIPYLSNELLSEFESK